MADPAPTPSRSRLRLLAAAIAGLLPLIPVAIGLSLGGGTTPATATTAASASHFAVVGSTPKPSRPGLTLPGGSGALVALIAHRTALRAQPGGRVVARLPPRTPFGSPQAVWVRRVSGHWLGVVTVLAGNNRLGWIPAADASLSRVGWELRVSLAQRRLTVLDRGRPVQHFAIAVGAPASPTPTGRFAVTDRLSTGDPAGPYGCCILALSALAPHAIQGWTGGNRIAIHSTPETSSIGEPVSHGCMRLTLAEGRWLLEHIPLGTPTVISS
ncbi:MAG TPA: L,D-transpeptidase [Solirubrobacteraceae bacterium]|nr:L,D-transpeptidase [Solirubrobacteraceae bacterium]